MEYKNGSGFFLLGFSKNNAHGNGLGDLWFGIFCMVVVLRFLSNDSYIDGILAKDNSIQIITYLYNMMY